MKRFLLVGVAAALQLAAFAREPISISAEIPVLTMNLESGKGKYERLPFEFSRNNSNRPLKVAFSGDTPQGSGEQIQGSVWLAAITASMLCNDPLDGVRIMVEFSGRMDGPSMGGVMCLAIMLAMEGKEIPPDFAMTGTIWPDGSIGVVGGVSAKMRAAAARGVRRICIPAFQRFEPDTFTDLHQLGKDLGMTVYPVCNIKEVYQIAKGEMQKRGPTYDERSVLAVPEYADRAAISDCNLALTNLSLNVKGNEIRLRERAMLSQMFDVSRYQGFADAYDLRNSVIKKLGVNHVLSAQYDANDYLWGRYTILTSEELRGEKRWNDSTPPCGGTWLYYWAASNTNAVRAVAKFDEHPLPILLNETLYKNGDKPWGRQAAFVLDGLKEQMKFLQTALQDMLAKVNCVWSGGNPVALQCASEMNDISTALGMCNWYLGKWDIENLKYEEVAKEDLTRSMNDAYLVMKFAERRCVVNVLAVTRYDEGAKEPVYGVVTNMAVHGEIPKCDLNGNAKNFENLFVTAVRTVFAALAADMQQNADEYAVSFNDVVNWRGQNDPQLHIAAYDVQSVESGDSALQKCTNKAERDDRLALMLYWSSQALAKVCVEQVKYSPDMEYDLVEGDVGNKNFLQYLIRMARETALASIAECKQAGVPCVDPLLRFQLAEDAMAGNAMVGENDLLHGALENFWRANLGAKALRMGFADETSVKAQQTSSTSRKPRYSATAEASNKN